jgi:hypothetical protein
MTHDPITKFWLVWNVNAGAPHHKHFSKALARAEAERLSRLAPGNLFVVLAAVDVVISQINPPETVKLTKPTLDDEIPF